MSLYKLIVFWKKALRHSFFVVKVKISSQYCGYLHSPSFSTQMRLIVFRFQERSLFQILNRMNSSSSIFFCFQFIKISISCIIVSAQYQLKLGFLIIDIKFKREVFNFSVIQSIFEGIFLRMWPRTLFSFEFLIHFDCLIIRKVAHYYFL
jgi:hypothetical protein